MNGTVAQAFALTCHANAVLSGLPARPFFPRNSTARFCDRIGFVHVSSSGAETEAADDPDAWFEQLKNEGIAGVRLSYAQAGDPKLPDRVSSAFVGGGGAWSLRTLQKDGRAGVWYARWDAAPPASRPNVWRVTYGRVGETAESPSSKPLAQAIQDLRAALQDIRNFSMRSGPNSFTGIFTRALLALEPQGSRAPEDDLFPPESLGPEARALLDACRQGWVFGGMGSWNDTGDGGPDYDLVSDQLYRALCEGLCAAANDSEPRRGKASV